MVADIQLPLSPWSPPEPKYRDHVNSFALYSSSNDLGIPDLLAEQWIPDRLVAFNDPRNYGSDAGMHFFLDDYRFETVWKNPAKYVERFNDVGAVLTPDFSCYTTYPLSMQLWQTYRNRWVGAHLQSLGFRVIPTVTWADPADFYFMGLPKHSVLAVATTGVRRSQEAMDYFWVGFSRLTELEPTCVLVYGGLDGIATEAPFPVREYPAFLDIRREAIEGGENGR